MVVFGDGASNGGAFFESLNIAASQKLPLLFLCENNEYAIGTHISRTAPFVQQRKKAEPYMPTMYVDGMDAKAVYQTVSEARRYIEEGHGPIFVEASTCRFEGHSVADANSYRSAQEMKRCKAKDPIIKLEAELLTHYKSTQTLLDNLKTKAQKHVDEAVDFARNSPEPGLDTLFEHVFCKECHDVVS